MIKIVRWFSAAALLLAPSLAFAQCSEVPGQGFFCNTLMTFKQGIEITPTTVALLSPCNASAAGQLRVVTDATTPSYGGALTGGGAVTALAVCNGTAWLAH